MASSGTHTAWVGVDAAAVRFPSGLYTQLLSACASVIDADASMIYMSASKKDEPIVVNDIFMVYLLFKK